jgi:hypothetical protein
MTLQFLREQRRTALRSLARCSCGPLLLPTRTTPSAHASTILPPIIQYCSVALSCPRAPIGHRTSIIAIVGTTRRSRSRSIAKPCASHSKPQNRPTRARIYGPSHLPSALSREEHVSHHGPPVSVSSGRTTTSRPPTRVVQSAIPTAISHAHRPTADANTLRGSLLARSRSVSPRTTWKERQSWTRSARMATRTRYVQEYVTQERDQRRAGRSWKPPRPQGLIAVQLLRTEFRSDLQPRHETPARLRYLVWPSRHATRWWWCAAVRW